MSKRFAIVLCCFAAIVVETIVIVTLSPASAKEVGWHLQFKPGQTFDYTLQCSTAGPHSHISTSTTMAATVTSVAGDGTASIDSKSDEYVVAVGRDGVEKRSGPFDVSSRLSITSKGLTTCPDNTGDQSGMVAPNDGAVLPGFNPKPGDTWDLPSPIQGITAHARLTSIQVDSKGHRIARIDSTAIGTTGSKQRSVSLTSTAMFDIDRGIFVSRQATMQIGSPVDLATFDRQDLVKASD